MVQFQGEQPFWYGPYYQMRATIYSKSESQHAEEHALLRTSKDMLTIDYK
jgi:hypothetical protein